MAQYLYSVNVIPEWLSIYQELVQVHMKEESGP